MFRELKRGMKRPALIGHYLQKRMDRRIYKPLKDRFIDWRVGNRGEYVVGLDGYDLKVDLSDGGLGRDLLIYGKREPVSYEAYRERLRALSGTPEDPVRVADIGSNIGYYALAPAVDIDDVVVYAVEIDEANFSLLEENIALNGLGEKFRADRLGLGDENGVENVHKSYHSNRHSLQDQFAETKPELRSEMVEEEIVRGESWLARYDTSPAEIDVVRMDLEGYEAKVLRGLPRLLSSGPVLIHMEVHPKFMDRAEIDYVRDCLRGTEIDVAARGRRKLDVTDVDELLEYPWVEFVGVHE